MFIVISNGTASSVRSLLPSDAARQAVRAGQFAPTFRLRDLHGGNAAMVDLIGQRALVISFYRGVWCSFCDTVLEAMAGIDGQIQDLRATQVAIGPPPENEDQSRKLQALPMPVLVDHGLRVARAYGLAIRVLVPATYVIDRGGRIVLASIDTDYRNRLDPAQVLSALRCLRKRHT